MPPQLHFHPEVKTALDQGKAVVALESTVITHGLPAPENIQVARAIEAAVREQGAVPATVAILGGEITVGLTPEQLVYLGSAKNVHKCSRRDFPVVVARAEDGATTVAGTMMVAHWAGIRVFATGGIGGVHRGHPFDESADLLELGRTPVAVVCAGAKAILDLPLTLEVLETQGVPVIGYQTNEFPAFYSRSSGLPLELRVETASEIAAILKAHDQMGLTMGTLITNPVPSADEWPAVEAQSVIEQALRDAETDRISGKAVTPYLLQRVSDLSGERSKKANIALLLNNARLGAQIALALTADH
ncbi:MAG: pseudouridine-5'-phosphate glycosidase [Anaerolineales bacterium]|nr:pseudouridine-5'-phosphate glycosidase [Anaerolineales bacterium]